MIVKSLSQQARANFVVAPLNATVCGGVRKRVVIGAVAVANHIKKVQAKSKVGVIQQPAPTPIKTCVRARRRVWRDGAPNTLIVAWPIGVAAPNLHRVVVNVIVNIYAACKRGVPGSGRKFVVACTVDDVGEIRDQRGLAAIGAGPT